MAYLSAADAQTLTLQQVGLVACGYCPWCEAAIRGWMARSPTVMAVIDNTIDAATGHKSDCAHKEIEL